MQNRVFFPQEALDQWTVDGKVDLRGGELTILAEKRMYRLLEAVHVVREVTGARDPHDLIGKVKAKPYLLELGAELFETSMLIGDNAYDVVPGWLGRPASTFRDHVASDERRRANKESLADFDDEPKTDEDVLQRCLLS